ncbi:flagellar biosynthesis anti-sigma factor FlgM, partial [Acinetobacter baumannii]
GLAPASPNPAAKEAGAVKDSGAATQVDTSDAVKAGDAPVDPERVATIRKAIDEGKYPVIPVKIADAMIAAGILLRKAD